MYKYNCYWNPHQNSNKNLFCFIFMFDTDFSTCGTLSSKKAFNRLNLFYIKIKLISISWKKQHVNLG